MLDQYVEAGLINTRLRRGFPRRLSSPKRMARCALLSTTSASTPLWISMDSPFLPRTAFWTRLDLDKSVRWWARAWLVCQARKTLRQTVRWPDLAISLPNAQVEVVGVDFFGSLPITSTGNSYILLFMDRFSRRADMFATTSAEFTAKGTATIFVNQPLHDPVGMPDHAHLRR